MLFYPLDLWVSSQHLILRISLLVWSNENHLIVFYFYTFSSCSTQLFVLTKSNTNLQQLWFPWLHHTPIILNFKEGSVYAIYIFIFTTIIFYVLIPFIWRVEFFYFTDVVYFLFEFVNLTLLTWSRKSTDYVLYIFRNDT